MRIKRRYAITRRDYYGIAYFYGPVWGTQGADWTQNGDTAWVFTNKRDARQFARKVGGDYVVELHPHVDRVLGTVYTLTRK